MKSSASPLAPVGKLPVKLPSSELPTRSVTPGPAAVWAEDDDRVLVRRQLGLGQLAVVERDRVVGRVVADLASAGRC